MSLAKLTQICQSFISQNPAPSVVSFDDVSHFYTQLIDCISDHNHRYYVDSEPMISDKEYDELFAYLVLIEESFPQLINQNSPTQQLVNQIADGFVKAEHTTPLLSLENSYNSDDLLKFDEFVQKRTSNIDYLIQPKFDGITVEVIYKNGKLHQAITRGDGKIGEDITANVKTIKNLPKTLKKPPLPRGERSEGSGGIKLLSLRGEIMMPKSVRTELNQQREEQGLSPFANTRNAASGSMKLLDSAEVARRGLVVYIFDILTTKGEITFDNAVHERELLKKRGLPIYNWEQETGDIHSIIKICEDPKTQEEFFAKDIDFDGMVIKVNQLDAREELGSTEHHPRWAMAYKFPAQQVATQIESVDFQIGRTGIVTPVGNLTPVQLSGVTISRVSLHNFDFIKDKDIHIGDWVWIQRSGEVIPYVVGVIKDRRENDVQNIVSPTLCPVCGHDIHELEGHNYCINTTCPAILKGRLDYFVSKQCMNIDGIGGSIIDVLVEQGIVEDIADLYKLTDNETQQQLKRLPGFGDKKVSHMATELEKSKSVPLRRFINGLGLPGVGKKTAQSIANKVSETAPLAKGGKEGGIMNFSDLEILLTNQELMNSVDGIGTIIVQGLSNYFKDENHHKAYEKLEKAGVTLNVDTAKNNNGLLSGQHFSLTGSFPVSRDNLVEQFEAQGATFMSSPGKKTDFMLIGEKPGNKKAKAEKLEITIYEGRAVVQSQFPFLKAEPPKANIAAPQSLFG